MEEAEAIETLGQMEELVQDYIGKFKSGKLKPEDFSGYAGEGNLTLFSIQAGCLRAYIKECLGEYPASGKIAALAERIKDSLIETENILKPAFKS